MRLDERPRGGGQSDPARLPTARPPPPALLPPPRGLTDVTPDLTDLPAGARGLPLQNAKTSLQSAVPYRYLTLTVPTCRSFTKSELKVCAPSSSWGVPDFGTRTPDYLAGDANGNLVLRTRLVNPGTTPTPCRGGIGPGQRATCRHLPTPSDSRAASMNAFDPIWCARSCRSIRRSIERIHRRAQSA